MRLSPGTSLYLLDLAICAVYFAVGTALSRQARQHLKQPRRLELYTSLYSPEMYRPSGQHLRRRALAFWLVGALGLVAYFGAWRLVQRA
jgi:hypothetical protein